MAESLSTSRLAQDTAIADAVSAALSQIGITSAPSTSGTNFLRPNATYRRFEYYLIDAVGSWARSPMSSQRSMFYHSIFRFNLKTIWVPRRHFSHLPWPDAHQPLQAPHNLAVGLPCFAIAHILLSLLYMCTRTHLLYAYLLV